MIFVAMWFDRHADPQVELFNDYGMAMEQIEDWKSIREYEWIDAEALKNDEDLLEEYDWLLDGLGTGTWVYYITARMDDGPHGYIKTQEIR